MVRKDKYIIKFYAYLFVLLIGCNVAQAQEREDSLASVRENIRAKSAVADEHSIKLRWSPANPKSWLDGKKYGYTVERYTMMIDNVWQVKPEKRTLAEKLKPQKLSEWEEYANKSDYAAVIVQAFFGDDFDVSGKSGNFGDIINQAEELEQRFATSVFMAEYDYKAAELAGWACTDSTAKTNEKYLYRISLNRPNATSLDTAAIYTGIADKKELPKPIGLNAVFGDRSVLLSWNYALLSNIYHSYHIERKAGNEEGFHPVTHLPLTALNADMREIFYTDSLADNETPYSYRIIGLTSFDEKSPVSDTVTGYGKRIIKCIPYITAGDFTNENKAKLYWEFDCPEPDSIKKFRISRAETIDGDYLTVEDNLPVNLREYSINLPEDMNYVTIAAINNDGSPQESFPFLLRKVDSIPPAVPAGLKGEIDSLGIAHLTWDKNTESDFRGYRILRSFVENEEKSSLISDFLTDSFYTDTLSLALGNSKVYYSLTAVDVRYNESAPCPHLALEKPNNSTPANPAFTHYEINGNKVTLSWITDRKQSDVRYELIRRKQPSEDEKTVYSGDCSTDTFTDEIEESGTYAYKVSARDKHNKTSESPQALTVDIIADNTSNAVSGFTSYADRNKAYIELSWRKNDKAKIYRLYKAAEGGKMSLWKETEANRIVDENVSPDTRYSYTILFITEDNRPSKSKTITVNY
jgi:hypothetical protein